MITDATIEENDSGKAGAAIAISSEARRQGGTPGMIGKPISQLGWLLALLIYAAVVTAICVNLAYEQGPLVSPPRYDDVSYFNYTLRHLRFLDQFGFVPFVVDHFRHPPHSPLSTLLAYFAFGVFGRNEWSCYAANFFVVATFFCSVAWVFRSNSIWLRAAAVLYASTIAYTVCCVWNFRPDLFWGVCAAWASFYILFGSLQTASRRYIVSAAVLTAAALVSKPTIFPATIVSLLAALALNFVSDLAVGKTQFYTQLRNAAKIGIVALVLSAPYYVANAKHLSAYIKEVVFGHTAQTASFAQTVGATGSGALDASSKLSEFRCYFDGFAGMANFAGNQYILVAFIMLAAVIFVLQSRRRDAVQLGCGTLLLLIMFAIPTLTSAKGTFFASNFVAALILFGLWCLSRLENKQQPLQTALLTTCLVACSLFSLAWKMPACPRSADPFVVNDNRGFVQLYNAMAQRAGDREVNFACTTEGPFLAGDFLFRSALAGKTFDQWRSSIPEEYPPADFVIAQEDGVAGAVDKSGLQTKLLTRLKNDPDYQAISQWSSWNGKKVILFERLGDFCGVNGLYGLASTQWSGPVWRLRVATSPRCGLLLQNHDGFIGGKLLLACVPQAGVSALTVWAGDKELAHHRFQQDRQPEEIVVNIPRELGANPHVEIVFERAPAAGAASATFTKMKFVDVPGGSLVCKRDQASVLSAPQSPFDTHEW